MLLVTRHVKDLHSSTCTCENTRALFHGSVNDRTLLVTTVLVEKRLFLLLQMTFGRIPGKGRERAMEQRLPSLYPHEMEKRWTASL